jgi:CxxC-x17-CxxC domain-containing protein
MDQFEDRLLVCVDCAESFRWTAGEQLFYAEKGLTCQPKRCPSCKAQKNIRLAAAAYASARHDAPEHTETSVRCANCGQLTTVPFRPTQGRPVYCRPCFSHQPADPPASPDSK